MAGAIFLLLFFGIILFLIVVAIVGSKKEKTEKNVRIFEYNENNELSKKAYEDIYISLYKSILDLEQQLKNFKPSVGTKSISQINNEFSSSIKDLVNSKKLKDLYLISERREEFEPVIKELEKIQPKKWQNEAYFAYNIIKEKGKFLLQKKEEEKKEEDE